MYTQELVQAMIEDRAREAAELQRQRRALDALGRSASPRREPSRRIVRRLPIPSFVARVFRTASAQ